MSHYHPQKETVLDINASQKGLGASLLEENNPVPYISKMVTVTQCRVLSKTFISCKSYNDVARQNAVGGSLQPNTRGLGTSP